MEPTTMPNPESEALVACGLPTGELARRGEELRRGLFAAVEERRELPDGVAFRFPSSDGVEAEVFAFVATERTCCSFFRIELAFEPGLGPIWLTLRGPEGTKAFVREAFDPTLPEDAAHEVGLEMVPAIGRDELKAELDRGEPVVVIEALPEPYWRRAHIPGALNIPVEQVDELAPVLLPDKGRRIVVYCADLACPASGMAARRLRALGYADVREYAAGKQDWIEAGYPTERGRSNRAAGRS